jgi:hypothetical protein
MKAHKLISVGALARALTLATLAAGALACGRPFYVNTPPGFAELRESRGSDYAYRATSPDGVVMAIRVLEDEDRADLDFWVRSTTLDVRSAMGYALLGTDSVRSLDGTAGKVLHFGTDQGGKPYLYDVALFMAQSKLFIWEAGGEADKMKAAQKSIDWSRESLKVRCGGFLAPVLASHTCNRW